MPLLLSKQCQLDEMVAKAIERFPKLFDKQLAKGFHLLVANTEESFFENRSIEHLKCLLLSQYFLQKQIENTHSTKEPVDREVFVRIFPAKSTISISLAISYQRQSEIFNEQDIMRALHTNMAGMIEIPNSFYTWQSISKSYLYCYIEVKKARGREFSLKELQALQKQLQKQLQFSVTSLCPSVFWPDQHEESYRQIFALQQELESKDDLPQISIHFKGQTPTNLEFVVYMVCSGADVILEKISSRLPSWIQFTLHLRSKLKSPFAESLVFSIHLPISRLNQSINLLVVRKSILALIEETIGPFRDFNGGLFIKQEGSFGNLKRALSDKISGFALFAEKLFYSLKPIETQLTLSIDEATILFRTFSNVMLVKSPFYYLRTPEGVLILKTKDELFFNNLMERIKKCGLLSFAHLTLAQTFYLAILDFSNQHLDKVEQAIASPQPATPKQKSLRLFFHEGSIPSLNPYYLAQDTRCRLIYKSLFEGLTRINEKGEAELAGADSIHISPDQTTYTCTLRPNRWSNGQKVTASHYELGWKRALSNTEEINRHSFLSIKNGEKILNGKASPQSLGVESLDEKTLIIHLEHPDPYFLEILAHPPLFPTYDDHKEPLVFNGPFLLKTYTQDVLQLERSPYFWDQSNHYIELIDIRHIPNPQEGYELYQRGEMDWIGAPISIIPPERMAQLEKQKAIQKHASTSIFWLYINTKCHHLSAIPIREALNALLDRAYVSKHFFNSTRIGLPFSDAQLQNLTSQDPKKAKKQFQLGLKQLGLTLATFPPIELSYFEDPRMKGFAEYLKDIWESSLGIKVQIKGSAWNIFRESLDKNKYQIGGCFEVPLTADTSGLLDLFADTSITQWTNPLFKETISLARKSTDPKIRAQKISEAADLIAKELPIIPISNSIQCFTHHPSLKHYVLDAAGTLDFRWATLEK